MREIKTGVTVKVLRGKYKNSIAKVLKVKIAKDDPKNSIYLYLEGVGLVKKAVKANPALGVKGGFKQVQIPIHISNVMLYNPEEQKS
jgi:large subunit ribosomal protein L24